jgi:hypothetical protein
MNQQALVEQAYGPAPPKAARVPSESNTTAQLTS